MTIDINYVVDCSDYLKRALIGELKDKFKKVHDYNNPVIKEIDNFFNSDDVEDKLKDVVMYMKFLIQESRDNEVELPY